MAIRAAFRDIVMSLPVASVIPQRSISNDILKGNVYKQIVASIKEIGLVEPLAVFPRHKEFILLDGHLRLHAVKQIGFSEVKCLISADDESYTFNQRVNHIPPVAQHFMIVEAMKHGVSEKRIAAALNVEVSSIREKSRMLVGICEEVVEIVRDRHFSPNVFSVLRKMKPAIQIATAELMRMREDFTVSFAKTRLALTPPDLLVDQPNGRKIKKDALAANAMLQEDTELLVRTLKSIEESYGSDVLTLTVCCTYIETLLGNHNVTRYLQKHHAGTFAALHSAIKNAKAGS